MARGIQTKFTAALQKVQIGFNAFAGISLGFGVDITAGHVNTHIVARITFYMNGILGSLVQHQSNTGTHIHSSIAGNAVTILSFQTQHAPSAKHQMTLAKETAFAIFAQCIVAG